jgi:hypothetical protein
MGITKPVKKDIVVNTENNTLEVHLRSINKTDFDEMNRLRKAHRYTWADFFKHLVSYKQLTVNLFNRGLTPDLCTVKSMATVGALLPKWCSNIGQNMSDIIEGGDISTLVCKTRYENKCYKLDKLEQMLKDDSIEYTQEETALKCEIPLDMLDQMLRKIVSSTDFVSIAGSKVCDKCTNVISTRKPALIIGAGPSLYQNGQLQLLNEKGFNGDIFVVSKALKPVLDAGIVPTYVGALDAEEYDTTFFDHDIVDQYADQITGLFGINIHPTTWKRFKGKRKYFSGYISESDVANVSHTLHLITKTSSLSVSGNVGSSLYNIASFLGYNPIVMIGMDLSFPTMQSMKEYYPKSKKEDWDRTFEIGTKKIKAYKRGYNKHFKTGYFIEPVFDSYRISTLSWAKALRMNGIVTINCTEGGSIHSKDILCMKLKDYLNEQEKYNHETNETNDKRKVLL